MGARESSSELSSLAASVLNYEKYSNEELGGMEKPKQNVAKLYNSLLTDAKRLAGSVLSQDETPGQGYQVPVVGMEFMSEEAVEQAHDAVANEPEPNAPDPSVMREEFINVILGKGGVSRGKAESIVDAILLKQMQFYASIADPVLEADSIEQMSVVMEAKGIIEALIRQGAAGAESMLPDARDLWRRTAERGRALARRLEEMFT